MHDLWTFDLSHIHQVESRCAKHEAHATLTREKWLMGQGYRCIYHVNVLSICSFSEANIGALAPRHRTTIAVEDPEKEATTLSPRQRQNHSESPKPDFIHCSSVSKQVWIGRNRETLGHYHDRGFLEQGTSRDRLSQFPKLRIVPSNRRQLKHLSNPIFVICLRRISRQRNR